MQNGKARSNRAENLQLTAWPRKGTSHRPGTPSKGRTFQRQGFHLGENPSERAQDAAGPGPLERATRGGQGHKVRTARKRGSLAKGRKTQRAQGHSKGPPGGSGPQVHPVQHLHFQAPVSKRRSSSEGVCHQRQGGAPAFKVSQPFHLAIAISPSHIPTDIVVMNISCVRCIIAGHTKPKYTFDYQINTGRVLDHLIGPWAARQSLT